MAGILVAGLKRAPVLLNVADLWPDAAIQFGALRNRAAIAGARALERSAYRHADLIAVLTPGLHRVLAVEWLERELRSMLRDGRVGDPRPATSEP